MFHPIILAAVVHYGLVIGSIKLAVVTLVPIDKRNGKDYNNLIANKVFRVF